MVTREHIILDDVPWSRNQLRRLGERIRNGAPQAEFPTYDDVQLRYLELAAAVQARIAEIDWRPLIGRREIELTSRAKTIGTLRDKLLRDTATPLSNVQDLAGVRFEAEMSLSEQTAVAYTIARIFDHNPSEVVRDYREQPHSGYRAIHIWLRNSERVEVQVRTTLQGAWANLYEAAGDKIGRLIRYGDLPQNDELRSFVVRIQEISTITISKVEQSHDQLYMEASDYEDFLRRPTRETGDSRAALISRNQVLSAQKNLFEELKKQREIERKLALQIRALENSVRKMRFPKGGTL
jgi:ppGpp synthetase/RelA/SpoT-type nucleotidyltranferase